MSVVQVWSDLVVVAVVAVGMVATPKAHRLVAAMAAASHPGNWALTVVRTKAKGKRRWDRG